jgi:hypothetical protein
MISAIAILMVLAAGSLDRDGDFTMQHHHHHRRRHHKKNKEGSQVLQADSVDALVAEAKEMEMSW